MHVEATVKKLPKSEVEITVTLPWEEWSRQIDKAAQNVAKDVKVQGFRPGKVPRAVLEQKYGKALLLSEAAELAIQASYPHVLQQEKLDAIGRPQAEIKTVEEGKALEYVVKTAIVPEVKLKKGWDKDIQKVNKEQKDVKVEVTDEDLDKEIQRLAQTRAKFVAVDREAKKGDNAEVDFQVTMGGVPIEGGTSKKHPIVLGSGAFIPGFEEALEGMKAGEEKEFELVFPAEYHAKDLAGKPAMFKVKLVSVQERETPEIDDAFAQSLGKFKDLAELKDNFRTGMAEEKKAQAEEAHRTKMLDVLVAAAETELPEVLVHDELHKMMHEFDGQIQGMGMDFQEYLNGMGKTKEDLEKDWHPQAEKRLTASLALEQVAREKEVEASPEEIEAEMNKTMQYYRNVKDMEKNIDLERLYTYVKGKLQNEAVFKVLEKM
jgi:trigger factor